MGHSYTSRGEAAPFEFELDGVGFVCGGGVSLLDLLEVTRMAQFDVDSPEGAAAIADLFKESMGKAEYARFRQHCREHNTEPDTIIEIMQDLVEHVTGGPYQAVQVVAAWAADHDWYVEGRLALSPRAHPGGDPAVAGGSGPGGGLGGLTARQGVAVLFVLMDDWLKRRRLLAALGVEEVDVLDELLTSAPGPDAPAAADDPGQRAGQVAAFMAVAGGI